MINVRFSHFYDGIRAAILMPKGNNSRNTSRSSNRSWSNSSNNNWRISSKRRDVSNSNRHISSSNNKDNNGKVRDKPIRNNRSSSKFDWGRGSRMED